MNTAINVFIFFFFNDTATTEIYTLSLHDALPISHRVHERIGVTVDVRQLVAPEIDGVGIEHPGAAEELRVVHLEGDRKSTRLNSSHGYISYAVFCLKKKKQS